LQWWISISCSSMACWCIWAWFIGSTLTHWLLVHRTRRRRRTGWRTTSSSRHCSTETATTREYVTIVSQWV